MGLMLLRLGLNVQYASPGNRCRQPKCRPFTRSTLTLPQGVLWTSKPLHSRKKMTIKPCPQGATDISELVD